MCPIGVYGAARLRVTPGRTRPGTSQAPGAAHTRTPHQLPPPPTGAARVASGNSSSRRGRAQPPAPGRTPACSRDNIRLKRQTPRPAVAVTRRLPHPPHVHSGSRMAPVPVRTNAHRGAQTHRNTPNRTPGPTRRVRSSPPRVTAPSQTGVLNRHRAPSPRTCPPTWWEPATPSKRSRRRAGIPAFGAVIIRRGRGCVAASGPRLALPARGCARHSRSLLAAEDRAGASAAAAAGEDAGRQVEAHDADLGREPGDVQAPSAQGDGDAVGAAARAGELDPARREPRGAGHARSPGAVRDPPAQARERDVNGANARPG